METQAMKPGIESAVTPLFEEDVHLTGITEYGISYDDLLNGKAVLPPQGARFDLAFEGTISGPDIKGVVKGVDYMRVRSDGTFQLTIYATIVTDDGESIALHETGTMVPDCPGSAQLRFTMDFSTAAPRYQWLNSKMVWGVGTANTVKRTVQIQGYG